MLQSIVMVHICLSSVFSIAIKWFEIRPPHRNGIHRCDNNTAPHPKWRNHPITPSLESLCVASEYRIPILDTVGYLRASRLYVRA